jgi:hypothetical protein
MKRASDPTTHDTSVFSGTRPTEDLSTWQGTKFIHKFKKKKMLNGGMDNKESVC